MDVYPSAKHRSDVFSTKAKSKDFSKTYAITISKKPGAMVGLVKIPFSSPLTKQPSAEMVRTASVRSSMSTLSSLSTISMNSQPFVTRKPRSSKLSLRELTKMRTTKQAFAAIDLGFSTSVGTRIEDFLEPILEEIEAQVQNEHDGKGYKLELTSILIKGLIVRKQDISDTVLDSFKLKDGDTIFITIFHEQRRSTNCFVSLF